MLPPARLRLAAARLIGLGQGVLAIEADLRRPKIGGALRVRATREVIRHQGSVAALPELERMLVAVMTDSILRSDLERSGRFELIDRAAHHEPITVIAPDEAELPALPDGVRRAGLAARPNARRVVRRASDHLAVLDHPSFHASELERAGWIAKLCAAGVPVCAAEISDSLAELLGAELAGGSPELIAALRAWGDVTTLAWALAWSAWLAYLAPRPGNEYITSDLARWIEPAATPWHTLNEQQRLNADIDAGVLHEVTISVEAVPLDAPRASRYDKT